MFDNIKVSQKAGSGSGLKSAIIQAIVHLTETRKETVTPEQIAIYLNKEKGFDTNRKKVRVALQDIRNTSKATKQADGRYTEEISKYGVWLNYNEGQGVSYAAKPIEKKAK